MGRLTEWFANASVRSKILLGYALILLLMVLISAIVTLQADRIQRHNLERERAEKLWTMSLDMARGFASMNASLREYALTADNRSLTNFEAAVQEKDAALAAALAEATETQQRDLLRADSLMREPRQTAAVGLAARAGAEPWGFERLEVTAEDGLADAGVAGRHVYGRDPAAPADPAARGTARGFRDRLVSARRGARTGPGGSRGPRHSCRGGRSRRRTGG